MLLAQVCAEAGSFTVADSLGSITDKLVRRHPHVFGDAARAKTADEVLGRWEESKARERAAAPEGRTPKTILGGVPRTLPALLRAHEMGTRAAAVGFDWERATDVLAKIEEEVAELREAIGALRGRAGARGRPRRPRGATGGRSKRRWATCCSRSPTSRASSGVEPEAALRQADDKFARRFTELERRFAARGESLQQAGLARMEEEWARIKTTE